MSAHADGLVALWNIGDSDAALDVQLLRLFRLSTSADIMAVCIADVDGILGIAGGARGHMWTLDLADVVPEDELDNPSQEVREELAAAQFLDVGTSVIDCVEAIGDTHFAYKAACDEEIVVRRHNGTGQLGHVAARLSFPHTNLFFLRFHAHQHVPESGSAREPALVVAAGDHMGRVLLYEVPAAELAEGSPEKEKQVKKTQPARVRH